MTSNIALPRELRIGPGSSGEVGDLLAARQLRRPLIVTDAYLQESGVVERLRSTLPSDIESSTFADTVPDPTSDCVDMVVQLLKDGQHDCVIGLGGGSPMDVAKAAAVLHTHGATMRDYRAPRITNEPALPILAIPTTAGSGSECTRYAIVTDDASNEKMLCAGLAFLPVAAVVDYELTLSMPQRLTADTGVDALTHAIEAYVSVRSSPFTDVFALSAMRAIFANLLTVYRDPFNAEGRAALMLGSTQAGIAFSNSSVALIHGMSRPIGAHFHIAHGLSNSMLLLDVTAFSIPGAPHRYADCARALGLADHTDPDATACDKLIIGLQNLVMALGTPSPESYGVDHDDWHRLIPEMARQALASGSPANNPRVATQAEIEELYRSVW